MNIDLLIPFLLPIAAFGFFWYVLAALIVLDIVFAVNRYPTWSAIATLSISILFISKAVALGYPITLSTLGIGVATYTLCGILWALFRWKAYVNGVYDNFIEARNKHLEKVKRTVDNITEEDIVAIAGKLNVNIYVDEDKKSMRYLAERLTPKASQHKSIIVQNMAYWPGLVVWYIIADLVKEAWNWIYKKIAHIFQGISDDKFSGVEFQVKAQPKITYPGVLSSVYCLPSVQSRDDLVDPPDGEEYAIALDEPRTANEAEAYFWMWKDGKWSETSVLITVANKGARK